MNRSANGGSTEMLEVEARAGLETLNELVVHVTFRHDEQLTDVLALDERRQILGAHSDAGALAVVIGSGQRHDPHRPESGIGIVVELLDHSAGDGALADDERGPQRNSRTPEKHEGRPGDGVQRNQRETGQHDEARNRAGRISEDGSQADRQHGQGRHRTRERGAVPRNALRLQRGTLGMTAPEHEKRQRDQRKARVQVPVQCPHHCDNDREVNEHACGRPVALVNAFEDPDSSASPTPGPCRCRGLIASRGVPRNDLHCSLPRSPQVVYGTLVARETCGRGVTA